MSAKVRAIAEQQRQQLYTQRMTAFLVCWLRNKQATLMPGQIPRIVVEEDDLVSLEPGARLRWQSDVLPDGKRVLVLMLDDSAAPSLAERIAADRAASSQQGEPDVALPEVARQEGDSRVGEKLE